MALSRSRQPLSGAEVIRPAAAVAHRRLSCSVDGLGSLHAEAYQVSGGEWRVYYRDSAGRDHLAFSARDEGPAALVAALEQWARRRPGMLFHDAGLTVASAEAIDLVADLAGKGNQPRDFFHLARVLKLARTLGRGERADPAVLELATWFYGLHATGEETVASALVVQGVPDDVIERARTVARAVRRATTAHEPGTAAGKGERSAAALVAHRAAGLDGPEARALHDAVMLERLGAIGVARGLADSSRRGLDLSGQVAAVRREARLARCVTRAGQRLERRRRLVLETILGALERERAGADLPR